MKRIFQHGKNVPRKVWLEIDWIYDERPQFNDALKLIRNTFQFFVFS